MRDRGQITAEHEISQDRRTWIKAGELPSVHGSAAAAQTRPSGAAAEWAGFALADEPALGHARPIADARALVAHQSTSWFIARGDTHQGPLNHADLQRMLNTGEVGLNTLVWKEGMANWAPASDIPELRVAASPSATAAPISSAVQSPYGHLPRTSGLAIASLVLGLVWLSGIGSLLATIFGAVAFNQISRSNGMLTGKGMALAGFILGIVGLVFTVALPIFLSLLRAAPAVSMGLFAG